MAVSHFAERLLERYGIECTDDVEADILNELRSGRTILLQKEIGYRTCLLAYRGAPLKVVWQPDSEALVTALAIEADRSRIMMALTKALQPTPQTEDDDG